MSVTLALFHYFLSVKAVIEGVTVGSISFLARFVKSVTTVLRSRDNIGVMLLRISGSECNSSRVDGGHLYSCFKFMVSTCTLRCRRGVPPNPIIKLALLLSLFNRT